MRALAFKIAVICATIWVFLKYTLFLSGKSIDWFDFSSMTNNFLLLVTIGISIFLVMKSRNFQVSRKRDDMKIGIFAGMFYTVIVVAFSYYYNAKLDTSIIDYRIAQRMQILEESLSTEEGMAAYLNQSPGASNLEFDEIMSRELESAKSFLNPRVNAVILLMFFTLLVILYSFFVTLAIHKIYLKGLQKNL